MRNRLGRQVIHPFKFNRSYGKWQLNLIDLNRYARLAQMSNERRSKGTSDNEPISFTSEEKVLLAALAHGRNSKSIAEELNSDKDVVERIKDGLVERMGGSEFSALAKAIGVALSQGDIKAEEELRKTPDREFSRKDKALIMSYYSGTDNSQIMANLDWQLETLYKVRNDIYKNIKVFTPLMIAGWVELNGRDYGLL